MKSLYLILVFLVFALGFFTAIFSYEYASQALEHPLSFFAVGSESAPSDFIKESSIEVYPDKIILRVENASLSEYAPTGSMRPLFDAGANGIRLAPESESDINVGDIITFERNSILIVHRVIEKGEDATGVYFITKGDNNLVSDGKVRFKDIKYKTIGILY